MIVAGCNPVFAYGAMARCILAIRPCLAGIQRAPGQAPLLFDATRGTLRVIPDPVADVVIASWQTRWLRDPLDRQKSR